MGALTLWPALLVLLIVAAILVDFIRSRFMRYSITGGWIRQRTGVFFIKERTWEVLHIKNVTLNRGPLDRLTNNGQLVIEFEGHRKLLTLRGLARADKLEAIRTDLLVLARVLRGHRGILN